MRHTLLIRLRGTPERAGTLLVPEVLISRTVEALQADLEQMAILAEQPGNGKVRTGTGRDIGQKTNGMTTGQVISLEEVPAHKETPCQPDIQAGTSYLLVSTHSALLG